ncbi:MAG: hypothetical protein P8046_08620 [Anaerolineales bacterium]|jgi:hypothetical protein
MRITRDLLQRVAEDTVADRVKRDSSIIAAYLYGTVLDGEDPVMGGTADIDLVLIHDEFDRGREIVRMTEDVHLDIEHHSKERYQPPKDLRQRPYLGHTMFGCKALYDPEHFIDFTQAGVRSQFFHYDNVLARVEMLYSRSRAAWLHFHNRETVFGPEQVQAYLQAVDDGANAVACLVSTPLVGRRYLIQFRTITQEMGQPGLYDSLIHLLAGDEVQPGQQNVETLKTWMLQWEEDFKRLNTNYEVPAELHTHRQAYFMRAYEEMLGSDQPETILWPLLKTWTLMAATMPSQSAAWQQVCEQLGLTGPKFEKRLDRLDEFLDRIEVLIEEWEPESNY